MSTALVPLDQGKCPECQKPLRKLTVLEPAIVRGGGYGGTRRTVRVHCSSKRCGYIAARVREEVSPRHCSSAYS